MLEKIYLIVCIYIYNEELRKKIRREEQEIVVSNETSQQINVHQIDEQTKLLNSQGKSLSFRNLSHVV